MIDYILWVYVYTKTTIIIKAIFMWHIDTIQIIYIETIIKIILIKVIQNIPINQAIQ